MKKCPFCAEDIQDAAIVCKHCQRDLPPSALKPSAPIIVGPVLNEEVAQDVESTPLVSQLEITPDQLADIRGKQVAVGVVLVVSFLGVILYGMLQIGPNQSAAPTSTTGQESGGIKSDKFAIVHRLRGDTLTVSLDTDLPDFTVVMVSVSRSYFEKNSPDELVRNYFEEKSTVGRWRQPRQVQVSHDTFRASLQKQQRTTAAVGIGGELDRIEEDVVIGFTVPINQPNPAFGEGNSNLTGAATTTFGNTGSLRAVVAEASVRHPLDAEAVAGPQWANGKDLIVGRTYQLSRETPLMAELNPAGFDATLAVIASRKIIPRGGSITITEIATKDGGRWYQAEARSSSAVIGTGWINSDALIGQEVQVERR